jgi:ABC-type transport system involved in multi-copper enzyme maturation permease subunit
VTFLPIVARELRVRARQKSTYRFRLGGALIAILFMIFMLFMAHASSSPQTIGKPMFNTLAWLSFAYCLFEGVRNTADCLSEEKRAGTLGLLFLTDLKGYDVVLGKLMATSLNSFYAVLAIFPPLAIPILVGGVTGGEFWRLVLVLANTLLFSLCAGIFVSAISREERAAWGATVGLIGAITFVPIAFRLIPFASISWLEQLSPGVGFVSLFDLEYTANPNRYLDSLLLVHLWSWLFLISASVLLPRVWQEEPIKRKSDLWAQWMPSFAGVKKGERLRLGHMNPATWLVLANERPPMILWMLITAVAFGGVTSWAFGPNALGAVFVGALIVHFILTATVSAYACQFFANARSSGALELLLCTPLAASEIVEGHRHALRRIFDAPVVALLIVDFIIIVGHVAFEPFGLITIPIAGWCLAMLVMDLYAAGEYGMWLGLISKSSTQALSKTLLYVLLLPALSVVCCAWPVLSLVKNLILINYARDQLRRRFRIVAAEQFAHGDKETISPIVITGGKTALPPVLPR